MTGLDILRLAGMKFSQRLTSKGAAGGCPTHRMPKELEEHLRVFGRPGLRVGGEDKWSRGQQGGGENF